MNLHLIPRTRTLLDYLRFVYNDIEWRPTHDPQMFEYQTDPGYTWHQWYLDPAFEADYEGAEAPR